MRISTGPAAAQQGTGRARYPSRVLEATTAKTRGAALVESTLEPYSSLTPAAAGYPGRPGGDHPFRWTGCLDLVRLAAEHAHEPTGALRESADQPADLGEPRAQVHVTDLDRHQ